MATAYLAFWAGPFTPFFPLCIVVTLFIKRKFIDKKKSMNKMIDTNNQEVHLQKAEDKDFKKIEDFYKFVIDNDENMPTYCRWVYGLHPTDKTLHRYIDEGAMYYSEKNGEILSTVAILPYQEEDYHDCNWKEELKDDEVVALHLFCSNPKYKRTKIGSKTMAEVERIAKEAGKKAVRLDTLESNLAAQAFYPSLGYEKRDVKSWHADNTGVTNFILFEKML